jgi:site-specific DNA-methyltransferase (adenine-specific)
MQILHGDCLVELGKVRDGSVDLVLTDPPYGTTQNKWDSPVDLGQLWRELLRVGKPNAAFVFTASQPFSSALVMSQPSLFRHEWIWIKNRGSNYANTVREPMKEHESVLVFSRGKWVYNKQMQPRTGGGKSRVSYGFERDAPERTENYGEFAYKRPERLGELRVPSSWQKFNTEVGLHPTQKPVDLFRYLVRTYSNSGSVVLDPFSGSGTTAVACALEGRDCISIERDDAYIATILDRVKEHVDLVWCEQCGERPAEHDPGALVCRECMSAIQ